MLNYNVISSHVIILLQFSESDCLFLFSFSCIFDWRIKELEIETGILEEHV